MMAAFRVNHGGRDIDAYLKCTESQAQNLHDEYRRDKNTTFLVVCEFERADALQPYSVAGVVESDSEEPYMAVGTLVLAQVAKETEHAETEQSNRRSSANAEAP
jgi:hypothetical protein